MAEVQTSALVKKLEEVLVPVEPSPAFVEDLGRRLLAMARQRSIRLARRHRRELLIGAALGSLISLAGLYFLHSRAKTQRISPS